MSKLPDCCSLFNIKVHDYLENGSILSKVLLFHYDSKAAIMTLRKVIHKFFETSLALIRQFFYEFQNAETYLGHKTC